MSSREFFWLARAKGGGVNVEYVEIEGVDGRYFNCASLRALLSAQSCANRFGAASHGSACHACSIGAMHAGKKLTYRVRPKMVCCRCRTLAQRLVSGGICVSCYNRGREVMSGKNAKGVPPKPAEKFWGKSDSKTVVLHNLELGVIRGGSVVFVSMNRVADMTEAKLRMMRQSEGEIGFCWKPPIRFVQPSLFGVSR